MLLRDLELVSVLDFIFVLTNIICLGNCLCEFLYIKYTFRTEREMWIKYRVTENLMCHVEHEKFDINGYNQ